MHVLGMLSLPDITLTSMISYWDTYKWSTGIIDIETYANTYADVEQTIKYTINFNFARICQTLLQKHPTVWCYF